MVTYRARAVDMQTSRFVWILLTDFRPRVNRPGGLCVARQINERTHLDEMWDLRSVSDVTFARRRTRNVAQDSPRDQHGAADVLAGEIVPQ